MNFVPFTKDRLEAWDHYIDAHPSSTFYHTSAWFAVIQDTFRYQQKGIILIDGETVVGGVPLFEVKGITGRRLVSSPFRDRGGILVSPGIDPSILLNRAAALCKEGNYDYLLIKEGVPLDPIAVRDANLIENLGWTTTLVDLTAGSDILWKSLKNNAQGPVKQAEKSDLKMRIADKEEDMECFHDIFIMTRKRLGIPSFSKRFFLNIWHNLCVNGNAVLVLAQKSQEIIAGIILLLHKKTAIDGYAASNPAYRSLRPNDYLVWKSLEWTAMNGYMQFDFGADSIRQIDLLNFKMKWAGIQKPMHHYYLLNKTHNVEGMDSSDNKYNFARKLVSHLPMPIFKMVSRMTVARFG